MAEIVPLKVIFFDLGNTLVVRNDGWVPHAKRTLEELKTKGLRLGVISNTGLPPNGLRLQDLPAHLPDDFDRDLFEEQLIILSGDPAVGVLKPDLKIFQLARERATEAAETCLFCTESLEHTLAAQRVGMRTARVLMLPDQSEIGQLITHLETLGLLPTG